MALDQRRGPWRRLSIGALLGLACAVCAGCGTTGFGVQRGSFFITGDGMDEAFQSWREHVSEEDRAAIDNLMARKDVEIHIVLAPGKLPKSSRGGASTVGWSDDAKKVCLMHLKDPAIPWKRVWHVAYDPVRTQAFEDEYRIPTPVDVVLQHELFGHVLFWLGHPELLDEYLKAGRPLDDPTEPGALIIENKYRKRNRVLEVPEEWFRHSRP